MLTSRLAFAALVPLCATCVLVGLAAADNWPRFRGPNGSGVAADQKIPAKWSGDNILWKVRLPGEGNSTPVVWGQRIFLQTASGFGICRSCPTVGAQGAQVK